MARLSVESSVESKVARAARLLEYLESRGVRYAVMGDLGRFLNESSGDLDLVVDSPTDVAEVLYDYSRESGGRLVQVLQHEQTAFYFVLVWLDDAAGFRFLHPDVCGDYFRRGRLLLRAAHVLAHRVRVTDPTGFSAFVPTGSVNFIYYLIKKIDKRDLSPSHGRFLSRLWAEDPDSAADELRRRWPGSDGERICRAAAEQDWTDVIEAVPRLRRRLERASPRSLRHWMGETARVVRRIVRPTGLTATLLGPDGSGKSSVARGIAEALAPAFRHTAVHHLRAGVVLRGPSESCADPHARAPHGLGVSIVQLAAWWLEYLVAFCVDVLPSMIRSTLVVFDRAAVDVLVDPRRYRYGGPRWLARWIVGSIPVGQVVILLDANPETIRRRKQELTAVELVRQREQYREIVSALPQGQIVDADHSLDEVVRGAGEVVLAQLARRTAERHGLRG